MNSEFVSRCFPMAIWCAVFALCGPTSLTAQSTVITIGEEIAVASVKRLGINIGSRNRWGDAQILKNLIDNPGFEAGTFGSVALADTGSTSTTLRQAFWNSSAMQPAGFWDGADYEIVWGAAKGRKGRVKSFRHENGRPLFELEDQGAVPGRFDVMLLRRTVPGFNGNTSMIDATTTAPGSPGTQSLRLVNGVSRYDFFMDSYWRDGDRSATKFLPVRGRWRFDVWAKGGRAGDILRMQFFREGEAMFLDERVTLSTEWQRITREFNVPDDVDRIRDYASDAYRPILDVRLAADNVGGEVWVDDVAVERADQVNPTPFTDAFVDRLRELRPGIVRNWSSQLGSTLKEQLAVPFARGSNGYRPEGSVPSAWGYSLYEFLELAREVGAEPWYVVPPTFSPEDLRNLVEYLAAPALGNRPYALMRAALGQEAPWTEVFPRIHLEFGNELWGAADPGDPFFGASVRGGVRLGAIAGDRFAILTESPYYDADRFNLIIGGQAGFPGRQREIEQNSSGHDAIALAPYFGVLDTYASEAEIFGPLLAGPGFETGPNGGMRASRTYIDAEGKGTGMAIYEINFHTTGGSSPIDVRNDFLTGAAGALALPLAMLNYQRELGIIDQCAFSSLGFSFRIAGNDYARVWGMLRDLYATGRKRPTFLGVELANKGIMGDALRATQSGSNPVWTQAPINGIGAETEVQSLQAFPYRDGDSLSIILFNLSLNASLPVALRLPGPPDARARRWAIAPASIHDDNEEAENVWIEEGMIEDFADGYSLMLPPHSMTVLAWRAAEAADATSDESRHDIIDLRYNGPAGTARITAPVSGPLRLDLVDATGRAVQLIADRYFESGDHIVTVPTDELAGGVYFLRLVVNGDAIVRPLVVVR